MYPYFTVNGLPEVGSLKFVLIIVTEGICFFDIVINFFLQEVDEEGNPKKESRIVIKERYLRSNFALDVVIFLPIGFFMSLIDQKLKFFWVIKAVRIMKVNYYVSNRIIFPLIVAQIEKRQKQANQDENMKSDTNSDHIFIKEKILLITSFKIIRLIFQILLVSIYIG